ncbi:MAG TPA: hypothetical protein VH165_00300 [Kofleriaceae bacterium]|nr:hypothetical protein [Kofleriaceae bacterium]
MNSMIEAGLLEADPSARRRSRANGKAMVGAGRAQIRLSYS